MWRVVLEGDSSGLEYVYHVRAPKGASENTVQMSAFTQHGQNFSSGVVKEYVKPIPSEVKFLS